MCISETHLDSSAAQNSEEIQIDRYSLVRSDHPGDSKRVGVCLYYKESLGVKIINFTALSDCVLCKVSIKNCKGFIAVMYISPSSKTMTNLKILYLHLRI